MPDEIAAGDATFTGAPAPNPDSVHKSLTAYEARFVREYLVDLCPGKAVLRCKRYTGTDPYRKARKIMRRPHVRAAIERGKTERNERLELTADLVVNLLRDQAEADANELIEHRRECCRYCWGRDNRYQYTPAELERARADHDEKGHRDSTKVLVNFDECGGLGFNPHRVPNPKCQECHGDGVGNEFVHDTRYLSKAARALYAGIKVTEKGLEIKTNSQDKAREMLAKHTGVVKERHEHTGKDGVPLAPPVINIGFANGGPGEPTARSKGP